MGEVVTIAARERNAIRLLIANPGLNAAQLAYLLTVPEAQAETCLLTLETRGVVERWGAGWRRRRSDVRTFRRSDV